MATVKWRSHPTRDGVLVRTLTPEDVAEEKQREQEEEQAERDRVNRRWKKPIPELDWPEIEKIARRSWGGLGGEICDVISNVQGEITAASGRTYAIRTMLLHVKFKMEGIAPGAEAVSDGITVVVYRDPERPKRLRLAYGKMEATSVVNQEEKP